MYSTHPHICITDVVDVSHTGGALNLTERQCIFIEHEEEVYIFPCDHFAVR